ncbi:MAG TPA: hypothetical protein VFG10_11760 [Saprospiraceae bacterium]|nr:hypothetical protein [Saprospiraceae bacterium]
MNKIRYCFFLLLISVTWLNCTNEAKDLHLVQADEIMSQYNAGRSAWDQGISLEGNVTITATKYLTTIDIEPDSSNVAYSFFLQTENNEANLLAVAPGRAELLYLDPHIIVNSLVTPGILYFKLESDKKPSYLEVLQNMKEYTGYGLGMRKVEKGHAMENSPFCSCITGDGKESNCSSGGEGALSCGTGNNAGTCKITCSGQTIACCDSRSE